MMLASMLCAIWVAVLVPSGARGLKPPLYEPATGSALDIPAKPAAGCQSLLARSARLGPLYGADCESQRVRNSRQAPYSGPADARGVKPSLDELSGARRLPPLLLEAQRGAGASAPAAAISPQSAAALSGFLERAVARGDVPGVVALVVGPDGILYHEGVGKLNVARSVDMRPDAIFRIASMTKPITSVAALMLMDEGRLRLDDRVDAYLPAFRSRQVITTFDEAAGTYTTRPATKPITIRHLMTHTSGIGYAWSQPPIALAQENTGLLETELPLLHEPGERWAYGASTRVLGDVIAKISGQGIDEFLRARIFAPLGMRETSYDVPSDEHARVVTVHQRMSGMLVEQANPASLAVPVRGDGGLYSTARDYSAFLQMLLNGGRRGGTASALRALDARADDEPDRQSCGGASTGCRHGTVAGRIRSAPGRTSGDSASSLPRRDRGVRTSGAPAATAGRASTTPISGSTPTGRSVSSC